MFRGRQWRPLPPCGGYGGVADRAHREFARKARLGGYDTGQYARGIGTRPAHSGKPVPRLKLGDFSIKNAAVTISDLEPDLLGGDSKAPAVGLLGAEYLVCIEPF